MHDHTATPRFQRHDDVLRLDELDQTQLALVGGKAAHLGELTRIAGIHVPAGFCITTHAFGRIAARASIEDRLEQLSRVAPDDLAAIRALSAAIRDALEAVAIPDDLATAITDRLAQLGERTPCAVRSSATAEDLPTASFAGQQDTYLNVVGATAILQHVRRCWASVFTDRAVTYRLRNGIDQRSVHMAVVVQQMVFADAAGTLFTADPVTGNRKRSAIAATFGLGEALVSGLTNADVYQVRDGAVVERMIATKQLAIHASPGGGTRHRPIEYDRQQLRVLTDAQAVRLAELGRHIEAHFGRPQDIEWCLAGELFHIVQSRPITTLFPIPAAPDGENRVYVSVGHQQMMTDAMKPLGLSFFLRTTRAPMCVAGSRLFVDVTASLASPARRKALVEGFAKSDPLIADALQAVIDSNFVRPVDDEPPGIAPVRPAPASIDTDASIVTELIARSEASIAAARRELGTKSGPTLLDFILEDLEELRRVLFDPRSHQVFMAAIEATWWLNDHLEAWLGEKNAADTLAQSVRHNVTSEMGLALLDVADAIRPHPHLVAFLEDVAHGDFLDELETLSGGREARDAIEAYLDRYGMRCAGEIDITRPRWRERPSTLLPILVGNIKNFEPGAGKRRFEQGRQVAEQRARELVHRVRSLPDGEHKAAETARMVERVRTFIGYREYPKYGMVARYFVYKQALLREAERLVHAGVLRDPEDIFYLALDELHDVVRGNRVDEALLAERKATFRSHEALKPPRVLTSDGEMLAGAYRRGDVPAGALVGFAVSSGTVEGRARVIRDLADADLEPGDILVTAYTDPSWTPLFVAIAGLVTEVGGAMTHGAVIAREYGLPAVVGVDHAARLIRDGDRIRVHGTAGYVEILPSA